MSMTKKIEKKLLDKEEKRAKELLDELGVDKKKTIPTLK